MLNVGEGFRVAGRGKNSAFLEILAYGTEEHINFHVGRSYLNRRNCMKIKFMKASSDENRHCGHDN